ncbi:hypothetical protein ABZP36_034734 [Zizania latifolia]
MDGGQSGLALPGPRSPSGPMELSNPKHLINPRCCPRLPSILRTETPDCMCQAPHLALLTGKLLEFRTETPRTSRILDEEWSFQAFYARGERKEKKKNKKKKRKPDGTANSGNQLAVDSEMLLLLWLAASEMLCRDGRQCRPRTVMAGGAPELRRRTLSLVASCGGRDISRHQRLLSCKVEVLQEKEEKKCREADLIAGALLRDVGERVVTPELLVVLLPDGLAPPHLLVLPRPQRLRHLCGSTQGFKSRQEEW